MTVTEGENAIEFNQAGWTHLDKSNYKEADSRIVLHAANSDADFVISSKDADIFLLQV